MPKCSGCAAAGPTGPTGPGGPTGATGPAGVNGSTGATGPGGGGAPDDHMFQTGFALAPLVNNTPFVVTLDGILFSEVRGANISWTALDPTKITINATGVYDYDVTGTFSSGTSSMICYVTTHVNGAADTASGLMAAQAYVPAGSGIAVASTYNGMSLAAGDYLELIAFESGSTDATFVYGAINVTRRL